MVQPADQWDGNDGSLRRRFDRARNGRVPFQRQMRARFVVVDSVTRQDSPQVMLTEDDEVVGALSPDGADHPFAVWILPWRSRSCDDFLDSHVPHAMTEERAIDGVAISKQKSRFGTVGRERFDDLLSRPLGRRMRRHVEVNDAPTLVREDHEAIQQAEGGRRHDEEVAGDGAVKMVPEEGAPGLG